MSRTSCRAAMLEIDGLTSHYGRIQALTGISLRVPVGQLVSLVGANGAGKTTLLRSISGVQPLSGGTMRYQGEDLTRLSPDARVARGIAQVPEGRQIWGPMSVEDNLLLGAYTHGRGPETSKYMGHMYELFPVLEERRRQAAGNLSGGQQQMLAIARAMMARRKLLLLSQYIQMTSAAGLAVLIWMGWIEVWHILAAALLTGLGLRPAASGDNWLNEIYRQTIRGEWL